MPRTHLPYPPEFRHQMVERVRSGRAIRELARELECSDQTLRNWVRQAERDEGRRDDGLTTASGGPRPALSSARARRPSPGAMLAFGASQASPVRSATSSTSRRSATSRADTASRSTSRRER